MNRVKLSLTHLADFHDQVAFRKDLVKRSLKFKLLTTRRGVLLIEAPEGLGDTDLKTCSLSSR